MDSSRMFDYEALSRKYNVSGETLSRLIKEARNEFPNDEMMVELHVVRALHWLNQNNML